MFDRKSHTVLVVDDNDAGRYAICRNLNAGGYRILEASTGEGALQLVTKSSAIVLDVHLPGASGIEICRHLREDRGVKVPIIHISAIFVSPEDRMRGEEAGADAYLSQPVDAVLLLSLLDNLLSASATRG